jgi:hypothetical protein
MGLLPSWNEWLALREANARKRAVIASTKGLAPSLPGSTAACPSTNPVAMQQAKKRGEVGLKTEAEKSPNYSFDQWLKKAQKLGDEVKDIVDQGNKKSEDLEKTKKNIEKEVEKAEKSKKSEKSDSPERSEKDAESKEKNHSDNKSHEDTWSKFSQKMKKEQSTKQSTKPTKNSGKQ